MNIHLVSVFRQDKNLGFAYNEAMKTVGEDDWVCFRDYDTMFLTPTAVNLMYNYIAYYPNTAIFTCLTNRVHHKAKLQLFNGRVSDDCNIRNHIAIAEELE